MHFPCIYTLSCTQYQWANTQEYSIYCLYGSRSLGFAFFFHTFFLMAKQHLILGLAANTTYPIPPITIKLTTENFALWRTTIVYALETLKLESFISAPNPPAKTHIVAPLTNPP